MSKTPDAKIDRLVVMESESTLLTRPQSTAQQLPPTMQPQPQLTLKSPQSTLQSPQSSSQSPARATKRQRIMSSDPVIARAVKIVLYTRLAQSTVRHLLDVGETQLKYAVRVQRRADAKLDDNAILELIRWGVDQERRMFALTQRKYDELLATRTSHEALEQLRDPKGAARAQTAARRAAKKEADEILIRLFGTTK